MFKEIRKTAKLTHYTTCLLQTRWNKKVCIMHARFRSRITLLSHKSVKEGNTHAEAHLRCSQLRQSYFQTSPSPSPAPPPLVGKPHYCSGSSRRHDSRMDPLFTQAHAHRGLALKGGMWRWHTNVRFYLTSLRSAQAGKTHNEVQEVQLLVHLSLWE